MPVGREPAPERRANKAMQGSDVQRKASYDPDADEAFEEAVVNDDESRPEDD